ncbi:MAG: hypothetical protein EBT86_00675 [Actinobacteria bacterium]|nr:hypothetical protein [Actinomycetota bacterium]
MSDQNELEIPSDNNDKKSERFIPRFFRSESNKKFLSGTIDNLIKNGTVKRLNGFIGRQNTKSITNSDIFLEEEEFDRQNYQLEPALVSEDILGNVSFFKDYIDYINTIQVNGGNVSNHEKLNKQEFYGWNPHIDWDKIVNYLQYYWLPFGPEIIPIAGTKVLDTISTYSITTVNEEDNNAYLFSPDGLTRNPVLRLYRGETYQFDITAPNEPFSIKSERVSGSDYRFLAGVDNYAITNGRITFTVPLDAPDVLYYVSESNVDTSGILKIFNIAENFRINVEEEVIGKKTFSIKNNIDLTNGMKIKFVGQVRPTEYENQVFYVEGVGDSISLINERDLLLATSYSKDFDVDYDSVGFDNIAFNNVKYVPIDKDYITIKRGSIDGNPWSRYNRWFHQDVIIKTAEILGKVPVMDQSQRAIRPIIEFESNLKLFNFGVKSKKNVDLVDDSTTDVFSIIEGALGYYIDGVELLQGHRILFNADKDILVKNKIYKVEFLNIFDEFTGITKRCIHLAEEPDSVPELNDSVFVILGKSFTGKSFWFNGNDWQLSQAKIGLNQCPLFDLFDINGISLTDPIYYPNSTFVGNKIFSYKISNGAVDKELGFALTYRNINNIGDILFDFDLVNEKFFYKNNNNIIEEYTDNKFLKSYTKFNEEKLVNGWIKSKVENVQPIIRIYKNNLLANQTILTNNFPIDVYDNIDDLDDLIVKVYVNGIRLDKSKFTIVKDFEYKIVVLYEDTNENDIVCLKCFSRQNKNKNGYYEFPINFQNNPENNNIKNFTLGEVTDHLESIIDNLRDFSGNPRGINNLRDIFNISEYGTKFVQHSGSINLSLYHLTNENASIIRAIDKARDDYGNFKRAFIYYLNDVSNELTVRESVNLVLQSVNRDKTKQSPYYFSDMLGYTAYSEFKFTVRNPKSTKYPLGIKFNLDELTPTSINIYLNDVQLLHGIDYKFIQESFVDIFCDKKEDDIITLITYDKTDGCFIPPTPTSLGLYPKFEPKKYLDTTLIEPRNVIQGHDGSIILAYDDYRDDLILELEKRFFNNIKVSYDPTYFDIYDFIPGSNRRTSYPPDEFNNILSPNFFKWTSLIDSDFTRSPLFLSDNPFTYNYKNISSTNGDQLPGFWRGIYRWYFDTDRIHICPWESLGFTIKPLWWDSVYGPAPYTSNNLILWDDLRNGVIREPNNPIRKVGKFARPILKNIPVDENGKLLDPIASGITSDVITLNNNIPYVFGDSAPVENTWRRSSYYAFSLLKSILLMQPNHVFGLLFDKSRTVRSQDQIIYKDTHLRIRLKDILVSSNVQDETRIQTCGLVNYITDFLTSNNLINLNQYKTDLKNLTNKLSHRLSGFSSKDKFNLILDSKGAGASSNVFIPKDNYKIFLNTSSPIKKLVYSGIIITKLLNKNGLGYEIRGYNQTNPYFLYYPVGPIGYDINVGGLSEIFINWASGQRYVIGQVIKINKEYYRVKQAHTSTSFPALDSFEKLSSLPIIGGQNAKLKTVNEKKLLLLNYGTTLYSIQEVVDFIQGYAAYLQDQGFVFETFNEDLNLVSNWETSIKEFLFWTTQNWSTGTDKFVDWSPNTQYLDNQILYYNNEFFKAIQTHTSSTFFDINYYVKLDNLNSDGAAVITLSPAALKITLNLPRAVVSDLRESNYDYEIFSADGIKYNSQLLNYFRYDQQFSLTPKTELGIYSASFYLVQKEHVLIIDNLSQFNDVIYNLETGYRQEKVKISGYKTVNWNGSFDAPGFIYDQAIIKEWEPWTDYTVGDLIKYKEFYYTALKAQPGVQEFDINNWLIKDTKPNANLLPNWDYKALQFLDFYDLDSDNFDINQQRIAQHMVGYQRRSYLENIIKNDVSEFKFYQGMITEKGTNNSLRKLFDTLSSLDQDSIEVYEEWALRVGEYGAVDAFEEIEFILDETLFKVEPQVIELVNNIDNSKIDLIIRQTHNDLYLKPKNFTNNIWAFEKTLKQYFKTPGFCRLDQVKVAIDKREDILNLDVFSLEFGDYIWCGFEAKLNEFNDDWFIYRITLTNYKVIDISSDTTSTTLVFNIPTNFVLDDILYFKTDGVVQSSSVQTFNKFSKVIQTSNNNRTIKIQGNSLLNNLNKGNIKTGYITRQRFINIDNFIVPGYLNKISETKNYGELVWFTENNKNTIWKNLPIYNKIEIKDSILTNQSRLGKVIVTTPSANFMAVTSNNRVTFYKKNNSTWIKTQFILDSDHADFGKSIAVSDDERFIAISYTDQSVGKVAIYRNTDFEFDLVQTLSEDNDPYYGYKLKFAIRGLNQYSLFVSTTNGIGIKDQTFIYDYNDYSDSTLISIERKEIIDIEFTLDGGDTTNNVTGNNDISSINPIFENVVDGGKPTDNTEFVFDYDVNFDGSILVIGTMNKVYVYERRDCYTLHQIIEVPEANESFGYSVALSRNGEFLAASSILEDGIYEKQGKIRIYQSALALDESTTPPINYTLHQTIDNRNAEVNEQYGYKIKFINDSKTLVTFSRYGDGYFDAIIGEDSTRMNINSGRVDIYDRYRNYFVFSESLPVTDIDEDYGEGFDAAQNSIMVGSPKNLSGKINVYTKPNNVYSWQLLYEEKPKISIESFKKIFLYNSNTNTLLDYVDIIDPLQGKIAGVADQEIKFKTYYDPAIYNFKSNDSTFNVNVNDGIHWLDNQIGLLWWDLRRAKFLDYSLGDLVFRNSTWNTLYPKASIDIYEWVESRILPEQWDTLSGTEEGFSRGISGKSLYGNKIYSQKKRFDTISKTYRTLYYFWVKNKLNIPEGMNRKLNSVDIESIIKDPKNYGIKSINFLDNNAFNLSNITQILRDKDVILSLQYWTSPEKEKLLIHNEWKLISENEKTGLPREIERKWIDSLVGRDENGYTVPDMKLSIKQKYGIENKPRQSMFINRVEAVKQFVEKFNLEMKNIQIDNIDLTDFYSKDPLPSLITGLYDYEVDTFDQLRFINGEAHKQAFVSPVIDQGKIVDVTIINGGLGYKNPPKIEILGRGVGANIETVLNNNGTIIATKIINFGKGYDSSTTTLNIRPLVALVKTNEEDYWALYDYNHKKKLWIIGKTQKYDVTKFWELVDWYDIGYNQFTKIDISVNAVYELFTRKVDIGQVVKVKNDDTEWLLLEKYNDVVDVDYTKSFKVVGRQRGSLKLSSKLYQFDENRLGFDGFLYDVNQYDFNGPIEFRIILRSLIDKVLIDDKRKILINLFFTSLRYVLSEQLFVDWMFKTSFIKAQHNIGQFRQRSNYKNDSLGDFENYIKEVKPYRSKIREFTSVFSDVENTQSLVTDFDLPAYIENYTIKTIETQFKNETISVDNTSLITQSPWSLWKSNLGFSVTEVVIVDGGSNYVNRPIITFEGNCLVQAKARAFVVRGSIVKIEILDEGKGYFIPPKIVINGSIGENGTPAKAVSVIGNSLIRSNTVTVKFDRYLKEKFEDITPIEIEDIFYGDGIATTFRLRYKPSPESNSIIVRINGLVQILGSYEIFPKIDTEKGYREHYADLVLNTVPQLSDTIIVNYKKDFVHLNALERIYHYYSPDYGMVGRDFAQLMTGIDYGGVSIIGTGFEKPNRWDGLYSWSERPWDEDPPTEDQIYDTMIDGGNLNSNSVYRTASGLRAEDIIIDGDGFITPMSSPAPEEMLPGHVTDSLSIMIFERSSTTSSEITSLNFLSDGENTDFQLIKYPNSRQGIIVKINQTILKPDIDYTFDYDKLLVKLKEPSTFGSIVSITSLGFSGENLLDVNFKIINETTNTIVTDVDWSENVSAYTLVSGELAQHELIKIDTVEISNKIGIKFPFDLEIDQVVNYSLFLEKIINQSIVTREIIISNGTDKKYTLNNPVGKKVPLDPNVIVRAGDTIYNSVDTFKFLLIDNVLEYDIPAGKADIDIYNVNDYDVYINQVKVELGIAYNFDLLRSKLLLQPSYYKDKAEVLVAITKYADYFLRKESNLVKIEFRNTPPADTEIEIIAMFNHDILDIERKYYIIEPKLENFTDSIFYLNLIKISAGIFRFNREVIDTTYVWLTKNKKLLTPNIDYILLEDKKSIRINEQPKTTDVFGVITFSGNVVRNPVSFMKFKDMLNRFYYKRLSINRTTRLEKVLNYYDKELYVEDPDKVNPAPGVLYIDGERIEYNFKIGNRLGQLRRGTYGTGVPTVHGRLTKVYDIGESETIPYQDRNLQYRIIGDWEADVTYFKNDVVFYNGINWVMLTGNNLKLWDNKLEYTKGRQIIYNNKLYLSKKNTDTNKNINKIPDQNIDYWDKIKDFCPLFPSLDNPNWGQTNVGYLNDSSRTIVVPWIPKYRASATPETVDDINKRYVLDTEIFVGNKRLQKYKFSKHNKDIHPESPEGDEFFDPEYTTDGINHGTDDKILGLIYLKDLPPENLPITLVHRRLTSWEDQNKSLSESDNEVAYFLKFQVDPIGGSEPTADSGLYSSDSEDVNMDEE